MTFEFKSAVNRELTSFIREERGDVNVIGIFWTMCVLFIFALSVDGSSGWATKVRLQQAADAAAMAAILHYQEHEDVELARLRAVEIVEANLPPSQFGDVLRPEYVYLGDFNDNNGTFRQYTDAAEYAGDNSTYAGHIEASYVRLDLDSRRANAHNNYLFPLLGRDEFSIMAEAAARIGQTTAGGDPENMSICGGDSVFLSTKIMHLTRRTNAQGPHCFHSRDTLDGGSVYAVPGTQFSRPGEDTSGINIRFHADSQITNETHPGTFKNLDMSLRAYWDLPEFYTEYWDHIVSPHNAGPFIAGTTSTYDASRAVSHRDPSEDLNLIPSAVSRGRVMNVVFHQGDLSFNTAADLGNDTIYLVRNDPNDPNNDGSVFVNPNGDPSFDSANNVVWRNVVILADGAINFGLPEYPPFGLKGLNQDDINNPSHRKEKDFGPDRTHQKINMRRSFLFSGALADLDHHTRMMAAGVTDEEYTLRTRSAITMTVDWGNPGWCDTETVFNSYFLSVADIFWSEAFQQTSRQEGLYASAYIFMGRQVVMDVAGAYYESAEHFHWLRDTVARGCGNQLRTQGGFPMSNIPGSLDEIDGGIDSDAWGVDPNFDYRGGVPVARLLR